MKDNKLATATPESLGISSGAVRDYIEALIGRGVNLHSILVMRKGKICAEGYCPPYTEDKLQRMYSISKSFTSAAIGLMVTEGRISLDDKITDYFPEYLPENPHKWLLDIRIEDLLKMASAHIHTKHFDKGGPWVKEYLNCPVNHPPGTFFLYDTAASHILCALVEKLSGMTMLEYMRKKMSEVGLSEDAWCIKGTDGYSWGGSGVMATLRDLAKFALVMSNGGSFEGKQLIDADYVKKATTAQIFNDQFTNGVRWATGYGYQIWTIEGDGFAFRGMGSQHAICFPKQELIVCCTCDNQGAELKDRLIYEELYRRLLPALGEPMEENAEEYKKLQKVCSEMKLALVKGEKDSLYRDKVNGSVYVLEENRMEISELCFEFSDDEGVMKYVTPRGNKEIRFGFEKHVEYIFPETHYYGEQINVPSGKGYRTWSSAAWTDDHTLVIRTETLDEYLGNFTATFSFKGAEIGVVMNKTAEWFFEEYWGHAGGYIK